MRILELRAFSQNKQKFFDFRRKNDWWVESGGPPVTNGGRIMNQLDIGEGNGDPIDAT